MESLGITLWRLDFDHPRAAAGQQFGAIGPGDAGGEFDDGVSVQRLSPRLHAYPFFARPDLLNQKSGGNMLLAMVTRQRQRWPTDSMSEVRGRRP